MAASPRPSSPGLFGFRKGFFRPPSFILILLLALVAAGCIDDGPAGLAPAGTSVPSADPPGHIYLAQNVVIPPAGDATGTLPEDRTATTIHDALHPTDPAVRDFAVSLIRPGHGGTFRMSQACDIWDGVAARWTYIEDPRGSEYLSPPGRTIAVGLKGDCDDYAVLMAALTESVGGGARIVYAKNKTLSHAYPEVFIGTTPGEFERAAAYIRARYGVDTIGCHVTESEAGTLYWLNLDLTAQYPGGPFFVDDGERVAFYKDGRWERGVS